MKRKSITRTLSERDAGAVKKRARWLAQNLIWAGIAYLFGISRMVLETNPLGLALICAGGNSLAGVLLGLTAAELAVMESPVLMICTYAAAAIVRVVSEALLESPETGFALPQALARKLMGDAVEKDAEPHADREEHQLSHWIKALAKELRGLFSSRLLGRMATAGICALTVSLYRIIAGGFRYYDLFAALFMIAVSVAATPILWAAVEGAEGTLRHRIAQGLLLFALVWSADFAQVGGVSVAAVLSVLLPLLIAHRHGVLLGALSGILCGLAYEPLLSPAYLLAALVYKGIPWGKQGRYALPVACFSVAVWTSYAMGVEQLAEALVACLTGGAVFFAVKALLNAGEEKETVAEKTEIDSAVELHCAKRRLESTDHSLREISEAFSSLSEMFYNLSDRLRRPGALDLRRLCDGVLEAHCAKCPNKTVCWGAEYSETFGVLGQIISQLHTKGLVKRELVAPGLRQRCPSLEQILEELNGECARFTAELLRNNRVEIFAMDYEAAAQIIGDALAEEDGEYRFDHELESAVAEYLSDARITAQSVSVYGQRRRRLLIRDPQMEESSVTLETLRSDLGEMCGLELDAPTFEVEGSVSTMILQAKRRLSVMGAQNNLAATGGVSGDMVNLFSNRKDYFYALINDGMGAGKEAAFTSNLCSVFLEKMLRAGNRAGTSLRMLNNLIRSRSSSSEEECSSTVDLMELDLITGRASFIKRGAAPGFVVRRGMVHRLQTGSYPIGILQMAEVQAIRFDLQEGDTVVMVSDGILGEDSDGAWLAEYLSTAGDLDPEEIVYELCRRASEQEEHDDCSAVALRIMSAGAESADFSD